MEKRLLTTALFALLAMLAAQAQSDDFGVWTEANIEKKLSAKWVIDGGVEFRTRNDLGTADRWSLGVGATYKVTDWLKLSAAYSLLNDNNYKLNSSGKKYAEYWGTRHRFSASLTAAHSFGNLGVSLRERWQYTYRPEKTVSRYYTDLGASPGDFADDHTYASKASNVWRNRLQFKYKLSKPLRPYVNAESYVSRSGLDKMRYSLGSEIRLSKQHSFDVKYLYQHEYGDTDEGDRHVLGLGYTFKF